MKNTIKDTGEDKLYSITELAPVLDLHPKTILRFIHEGKINARKIGRTWRVSKESLKEFCHGELADSRDTAPAVRYDTLADRISVSAVIEIKEQNSEEASRISNLMLAVLNGESGPGDRKRFDFLYYPETETAKYVFWGTPQFIGRIVETFGALCGMNGEKGEENDE